MFACVYQNSHFSKPLIADKKILITTTFSCRNKIDIPGIYSMNTNRGKLLLCVAASNWGKYLDLIPRDEIRVLL